MRRPLERLPTALVLLPWLVASAAQPSASRGATLFQERCSVCHTVEPGAGGGQGPNLRGVVGRKAASTDFSDSGALTRWGRTWTAELLGKYLTNPGALVPGTTMVVRVPERSARADLVAYLASLEAAPAAAAAPVGPPDASVSASRAAPTPPAPPDGGTGGVLTGAAAFGDWQSDAPGVRRLIRVEDLPQPFVTGSARNSPRVVPRPADVRPRAPEGWRVDLFAERLEQPRQIRVAPGGDVFIAETAAGRIGCCARGTERRAPSSGGSSPTDSTARSAWPSTRRARRRSGSTSPRTTGWCASPTGRGIPPRAADPRSSCPTSRPPPVATPRGTSSSRSTASGCSCRWGASPTSPRASGRRARTRFLAWESEHGLGATWGFEERRADVLVFDPEGKGGRIFATGLRNCVEWRCTRPRATCGAPPTSATGWATTSSPTTSPG